jgi:hypothetical protein
LAGLSPEGVTVAGCALFLASDSAHQILQGQTAGTYPMAKCCSFALRADDSVDPFGTAVTRGRFKLQRRSLCAGFTGASKQAMIAFVHRFWIHYDIYRRYPLPWFPALRNAWRIARL